MHSLLPPGTVRTCAAPLKLTLLQVSEPAWCWCGCRQVKRDFMVFSLAAQNKTAPQRVGKRACLSLCSRSSPDIQFPDESRAEKKGTRVIATDSLLLS